MPKSDPILDRAEQRRAMLQELAEIGMELARLVRSEAALAATTGPVAADVGLKFARIARAVRQTLGLEARLVEDELALAGRIERMQHAEAERLKLETRRRAASRRVRAYDVVELAIRAEHGEASPEGEGEGDGERTEADVLYASLDAWLYSERDADEQAADAERPIADIVAEICQALGVTLDPGVWVELEAGEGPAKPARWKTPLRQPPPPSPPSMVEPPAAITTAPPDFEQTVTPPHLGSRLARNPVPVPAPP